MYDQLKTRLATLLSRPRPLKPQTDRQLGQHLETHSTTLPNFFLCASAILEDYELDILFGPIFTPTLDERAQLADLLFHWRPSAEQLRQLVDDLEQNVSHAIILLPDGSDAKLTLHEVMIERFVRLLRLDHAPDSPTAAAMRDALPSELWNIGVALLCERGMTADHQRWFAGFVNHVRERHTVTREMLETIAEFVGSQKTLDKKLLLDAAEALMRANQGTATYAQSGHAYWSPDVAQHHHYRGEGRVDQELLQQRQAELERVTRMVAELRTFEA